VHDKPPSHSVFDVGHEPPVHDKPPSHSVFDVGHEPPVTHTPPAPIELPSYGLFGLPGF
ncbi:hypothetical protein, partial [Mycobacterium tuberculosis]|uniref:hypothetical protein n=1 Tax=Mycobacterium tuberculosis TaxID=1773 RepID=UPI0039E18F81